MEEKILRLLFNSADLNGNFVPIQESRLIEAVQMSKPDFDKLIKTFLDEKTVSLKQCSFGRNFYCITKRGEKRLLGD